MTGLPFPVIEGIVSLDDVQAFLSEWNGADTSQY